MVTATHKWRRWSGPRSDLIEATALASDELAKITGCKTGMRVVVRTSDGLTERTPDMTALEDLHPHDLARIRGVDITLEVDRDEWEERSRAHYEEHKRFPAKPGDEISIEVWSTGVELRVDGDDRTRTQGLSQRLAAAMAHGARNDFDRLWLALMTVPVPLGLFALLFFATRWLGLAEMDGDWQATEISALILGLILGVALLVAMSWIFPPIEFLDEGQPRRFRRFRTAFWSVVVALVIGVTGSAIYGALA